jgi:hypothetical protein
MTISEEEGDNYRSIAHNLTTHILERPEYATTNHNTNRMMIYCDKQQISDH